jgi:hypothetical protein
MMASAPLIAWRGFRISWARKGKNFSKWGYLSCFLSSFWASLILKALLMEFKRSSKLNGFERKSMAPAFMRSMATRSPP